MDAMLGDALRETCGPFSDFYQKLAGPHREEWWKSFKKFLRKENPWPLGSKWQAVTLGTGLANADEFRGALKNSRVHISCWADDILGKSGFIISPKKEEVELVVCTTSELTNNKDLYTIDDVFAGAKRRGFKKCSPEVGPQLCLQYKGQLMGMEGQFLIGMEPIASSGGGFRVFGISLYSDGMSLFTDFGTSRDFMGYNIPWVFVRGGVHTAVDS